MAKKKKKRSKKKKKKKKGGRDKRAARCVARAKVMSNEWYLLERVLSYLPWRVKKDRSYFKPQYCGVSHFMHSYSLLAGASKNQGFVWWFDSCCDASGMFAFNATPRSEEIFRKLVWKNFYNEKYCDELVEACRSVCFKSERTDHQRVKSRRRSYTMLMLFSSDILTSPGVNSQLASCAYHLVGQWMVQHVKNWSVEVHKKGFFKQLREVLYFWSKAQNLGCRASLRAKRTVFERYSEAILKTFKAEELKYKHFII